MDDPTDLFQRQWEDADPATAEINRLRDQNTVKMHPHKRDKRLKEFARIWLNGPLPADLMADLADIMDDEDYTPEKRAHQIVWQAIKWGMEQ